MRITDIDAELDTVDQLLAQITPSQPSTERVRQGSAAHVHLDRAATAIRLNNGSAEQRTRATQQAATLFDRVFKIKGPRA